MPWRTGELCRPEGVHCGVPVLGSSVGFTATVHYGTPLWGFNVLLHCETLVSFSKVGLQCGAPMWGFSVRPQCGIPMCDSNVRMQRWDSIGSSSGNSNVEAQCEWASGALYCGSYTRVSCGLLQRAYYVLHCGFCFGLYNRLYY